MRAYEEQDSSDSGCGSQFSSHRIAYAGELEEIGSVILLLLLSLCRRDEVLVCVCFLCAREYMATPTLERNRFR